MASTAPRPSHLSEVFHYLSSSSPSRGARRSTARAYQSFQSSYYTFYGTRHSGTEVSGTLPDAVASQTATTAATTTVRQPLAPPVSAPRSSSSAPAVLPREETKLENHTAAAHRLPSSPSAPASPTEAQRLAVPPLPSIPPAAPPTLQHTVPSPVALRQRSVDRPADLDLDIASVGSIELPVEQQPDTEFLSPMARQVCVQTPSATRSSEQSSSFRNGLSSERPKALIGGEKLSFHVMGNADDGVDVHEHSQSGSHAVSFTGAPRVAFEDVGAIRKVRSFSVASLKDRNSSLVFSTGEGSSTFPGTRRVSLRRPIFDEDDDGD